MIFSAMIYHAYCLYYQSTSKNMKKLSLDQPQCIDIYNKKKIDKNKYILIALLSKTLKSDCYSIAL